MVLDDAVVDDSDTIASIEVRMGVLLDGTTVCCPTGVSEFDVTGNRIFNEDRLETADLADRSSEVKHFRINGHNIRGIIPTILQPFQSFQKDGLSITLINITDDSANGTTSVEESKSDNLS